MEELMKNISEAFDLLSTIPVKGQEVDVMAAARAKLRAAYQVAENTKKEAGANG